MTLYAKGTAVQVPPCRMHTSQRGVICMKPCVLRGIGTHDSEPIVVYWIAFEDGELCLHPHHDVEMAGNRDVKSSISSRQEALTVVGKSKG
jgi:hypothetical protein